MKIKAGRIPQYDEYRALERDETVTYETIHMIARQVETWMESDGLLLEQALGRILRYVPVLADANDPVALEIRKRLAEFWEYGEQFEDFVKARTQSFETNGEPQPG